MNNKCFIKSKKTDMFCRPQKQATRQVSVLILFCFIMLKVKLLVFGVKFAY